MMEDEHSAHTFELSKRKKINKTLLNILKKKNNRKQDII